MRIVTFRGGVAVILLILGALLGSLLNGGEATVRPVRLDKEPPETLAPVDDNAHILEAYLQRITSPAQGNTIELVPPGVVTSRCGDGDGCLIRVMSILSGFPADGLAARWFVTEANGSWKAYDFDGTLKGDGFTTDQTLESIVQVSASDGTCRFREADPPGTAGRYELYVNRFSPGQEVDCQLRIDD